MKIDGLKAVIFDLGGTLYRTHSDLCGLTRQFMYDIRRRDIAELSDSHIKSALDRPTEWLWDYMVNNNLPMHWQPTTEVWIEYNKHLLSALGVTGDLEKLATEYQMRWDQFFEGSRPNLIDDVKPTLEALRERGLKLAIASNRFSDPTELLKDDEIYHLFESVEFTNIPGYAKPSPFMLLRVAEELRLNPRRCAYVGNIADNDLVAAERAEMVPILLTWCDPEEVEKVSTDSIIIDHITELLEIL